MSSYISSSEMSQIKRFLVHAVLFLAPIILTPVATLYALPFDFFYHRPWEVFNVRHHSVHLPGPFYPSQEVSMDEQGGLGYRTRYAIFHPSVWITDRFGQRTRDRDLARYDVVIMGDSFAVCPGVSQDDILSETLERKLRMTVYPYHGGPHLFLAEKRFQDHPPTILVLANAERHLPNLAPPDLAALVPKDSLLSSPRVTSLFIQKDRWQKLDFIPGIRAGARRWVSKNIFDDLEALPFYTVVGNDDKTLFLKAPAVTLDLSAKTADSLTAIAHLIQSQGMRFILLPVPEKSTVYPDLYPGYRESGFLAETTARLEGAGVEVVDVRSACLAARARGEDTYLADDTHLNERGIEIAAQLLAERILAGPGSRTPNQAPSP